MTVPGGEQAVKEDGLVTSFKVTSWNEFQQQNKGRQATTIEWSQHQVRTFLFQVSRSCRVLPFFRRAAPFFSACYCESARHADVNFFSPAAQANEMREEEERTAVQRGTLQLRGHHRASALLPPQGGAQLVRRPCLSDGYNSLQKCPAYSVCTK